MLISLGYVCIIRVADDKGVFLPGEQRGNQNKKIRINTGFSWTYLKIGAVYTKTD
ncbi:MAG: hypothetical protein LBB81_01810 [Treponema sp.]|jgi:hypothetical protein|nr:hypothetical protein [Treponema sp.]